MGNLGLSPMLRLDGITRTALLTLYLFFLRNFTREQVCEVICWLRRTISVASDVYYVLRNLVMMFCEN